MVPRRVHITLEEDIFVADHYSKSLQFSVISNQTSSPWDTVVAITEAFLNTHYWSAMQLFIIVTDVGFIWILLFYLTIYPPTTPYAPLRFWCSEESHSEPLLWLSGGELHHAGVTSLAWLLLSTASLVSDEAFVLQHVEAQGLTGCATSFRALHSFMRQNLNLYARHNWPYFELFQQHFQTS